MRTAVLVGCVLAAAMPVAAVGAGAISDGSAIRAGKRAVPVVGGFPDTPGTRRCLISMGGPRPGSSVKGVCRIEIRRGDSRVRVMFTEFWNARAFTGPGSHGRAGTLRHRWIVDLAPGGAVLGTSERGAFAPQNVR